MAESVLTKASAQSQTRQHILDCADRLMLAHGYSGFAYQHIARQLGIRNATIHYHFPTKEALGLALVRQYREQFAVWITQLAEDADAWQCVQALIDTYRRYANSGQGLMCPCGMLAAEYTTLPDTMRLQARLLMRDVHQWLARVLERGRASGVLAFAGDAMDEAVQLSAALQGALQIARIEGGRRFQQVVDQLTVNLLPKLTPERRRVSA